jgi:hypothetical protein
VIGRYDVATTEAGDEAGIVLIRELLVALGLIVL